MTGPDHPNPDDDFAAEVSDLRSGVETVPSRPSRLSSVPDLTPLRRVARLAVTGSVLLLALLILLSGLPALRQRVLGLVPGLTPFPTPEIFTGDDLFSLLPNPPGVDMTLDGKALPSPPQPGDPRPLRLSPGHHTFAWRSRVLPFRPLQCRISVPRAAGDTCAFVPTATLAHALAGTPGAVITMHAGLSALAPADAARLTTAIQNALDAVRSTAIVQPGDPYLAFSQGQGDTIMFARQPLRATLSYHFFNDPGNSVDGAGQAEPCLVTEPVVPCRFPGQNCSQLCTVSSPPPSVAAAGEWVVAAAVQGTWDYVTLNGQTVAQGFSGPGPFAIQVAALRITRDAAGWHASPVIGHIPGFDLADDAACDPVRLALSQTSSWSFMVVNPPPDATVRFASDATPADGCAAELTHGQPALFLQRFDVLLTVNDLARNPTDNLPVASPADQDLAHRLLSQAAPPLSSPSPPQTGPE